MHIYAVKCKYFQMTKSVTESAGKNPFMTEVTILFVLFHRYTKNSTLQHNAIDGRKVRQWLNQPSRKWKTALRAGALFDDCQSSP